MIKSLVLYRPETIADMQDRIKQGIWKTVTATQAKEIATLEDSIYTVHVSVDEGNYTPNSLTYAVHRKVWTIYNTWLLELEAEQDVLGREY